MDMPSQMNPAQRKAIESRLDKIIDISLEIEKITKPFCQEVERIQQQVKEIRLIILG